MNKLLLFTILAALTGFGDAEYFTNSVFTSGIEGPAYCEGELYVVNYKKEGTIGVVDMNGNVRKYVDLPEGSIGNGIRISPLKEMFIADYTGHNILVIRNMYKPKVEVFAHSDEMNQPNDIAITSKRWIFASDPNWKEGTGKLWSISPKGKVLLLDSTMGTTNGIEVSPDDKTLYVNESVQRKIWKYDILKKGQVANKRLFYEFKENGLDGMRCDDEGNLFIARYDNGTVAVISPEGELIKDVYLPGRKPTNVAFGGEDFRTVFVTLQDEKRVVKFESPNAGAVSRFF